MKNKILSGIGSALVSTAALLLSAFPVLAQVVIQDVEPGKFIIYELDISAGDYIITPSSDDGEPTLFITNASGESVYSPEASSGSINASFPDGKYLLWLKMASCDNTPALCDVSVSLEKNGVAVDASRIETEDNNSATIPSTGSVDPLESAVAQPVIYDCLMEGYKKIGQIEAIGPVCTGEEDIGINVYRDSALYGQIAWSFNDLSQKTTVFFTQGERIFAVVIEAKPRVVLQMMEENAKVPAVTMGDPALIDEFAVEQTAFLQWIAENSPEFFN